MRHLYDAPGFGIGEVWARGGTVVQHDLASEALRREQQRDRERDSARAGRVAERVAVVGPATHTTPTPSPNGGARLPARTLPNESAQVCADFVPELCRRLVDHLMGIPTSYEGISIDLDWATPLQRDFAAAARAIPWGEIVSYGELAALAGRPGAARAAGSFCAESRFALIVPCHRVVAANGIGGYGSAGLPLKRRLLALEGIRL